MPDNMSPESKGISPSVYSMSGIGRPHEMPGAKESLRETKRFLDQPSTRMTDLLNPMDPNYDPRQEAMMRGLLEIDRNYDRDPLGLYSASSNLGFSMIEFNKLPLIGSPEFNGRIQIAVSRGATQTEAQSTLTENVLDKVAELHRNFALAVASDSSSIIETLGMLESFVPPKPFEANMQERELLTGRKVMQMMTTYYGEYNPQTGMYEVKLPEKIVGLYRAFDSYNEQQIGLFNILCATGGSLEGFYDALKQAGETVMSRARYHANLADFRAAYTNDNPGVTTHGLTPEEKAYTKDTLVSKELRELEVEMLSQTRRLILLNVDVAQYNVDNPNGKEGVMRLNPNRVKEIQKQWEEKKVKLQSEGKTHEAALAEKHIQSLEGTINLNLSNHREFMRLVFGEVDKSRWIKWKSPDTNKEIECPREILVWNASGDKLKDREEWLSRMLAILMWKDKKGKGISDFLENANSDEVLLIAKKILINAEDIRSNLGDKVMLANPEYVAASKALMAWIEKDKGFQKSGKLAWMFKYVDAINGKRLDKIVRVYDSGGLYKSFDSINLYAYWRRWVSYKASWKSATGFFGPASDAWRRLVSMHGPDWLPPFDLSSNAKIQRIHDRFFSNSDEMRLWRAQRLTGNSKLTESDLEEMIKDGKLKEPSLDGVIEKHLLNNAWTFISAWKDVPIPMYLPKTFKISLDEMMTNKSTKETLEDLYLMGITPKDVDWGSYNFESIDRMWISQSMLVRFAKFFVDPYDKERDPQWVSFFDHASTQNIAEMAKRVYLAFRDLPEGYQQYIVAIVPFMIAQQTASEIGLLSGNLTMRGRREKLLKQFNYRMSEWIRSAMWEPQVILDDQQLYDGANADIQSLRNDIALMIMYYKHIFEKVAQAESYSDFQSLSKYYNDQMGLYEGSMKEDMAEKWDDVNVFAYQDKKISENWQEGDDAVRTLLFGPSR